MAIHIEELLLSPTDSARISEAVDAAHQRASFEIDVHIEATCRCPEARARDLLRSESAVRGNRRPAMLLYLLAHDRRCHIVTDDTLRPLEGTRVWRDVANRLMLDLLHGKLGAGTADAVGRFSHIVAGHFPATVDVPSRSVAR